MNLKRPISPLKLPSFDPTRENVMRIVQGYNELVNNVFNPGDLVCSSLQFIVIAGSGYGLQVGGVYGDADGYLRFVRESDVFAPSFKVRVHLGTVTFGP